MFIAKENLDVKYSISNTEDKIQWEKYRSYLSVVFNKPYCTETWEHTLYGSEAVLHFVKLVAAWPWGHR